MGYTRRDLLTLLGTAGALTWGTGREGAQGPAAGTLQLAHIVERNDAAVQALLQSQITDARTNHRGSVPDQFGLYTAGSAGGAAETYAASFVHPQSKFHQDGVLLDRIRLAAGFLERSQSPQGNIDLLSTNFNSPPDTGFVVHGVATAAAIGRLHGAGEITRLLQPFLVRAGAGCREQQPPTQLEEIRGLFEEEEARRGGVGGLVDVGQSIRNLGGPCGHRGENQPEERSRDPRSAHSPTLLVETVSGILP